MFAKNFRIYFSNFNRRERITFWVAFVILCLSFIAIISKFNNNFLVEIPTNGGSYHEGIIGNPKFINPVIASSSADEDLVSIIYDGLTKKQNGEIVNNLISNLDISSDGLMYTATLKENLHFHDNTPLTASDVIFTIKTIQDPRYKSPLFNKWQGIEVEKVDDKTVLFKLKKPFSDFKNQLTIGILPFTYWQNVTPEDFYSSEQNIDAIGSGPYKISKIYKNSKGAITKIKLAKFSKYHEKIPYINNLFLHFYGNSKDALDDFKSKNIDGLGGVNTSDAITFKKRNIIQTPMTRFYALFLNQNKNSNLREPKIREIVNESIDRNSIVSDVLNGYGLTKLQFTDSIEEVQVNSTLENKINDLEKLGFIKDQTTGIRYKLAKDGSKTYLSIKISTAQNRELVETANKIKSNLLPLGIEVEVNPYDLGVLNQEIIKNRDFEILLFGVDFSKNSDAYALWNSKEKNYPGLNIAEYVNKKTDDLTESIITDTDQINIDQSIDELNKIIVNDLPVIFLYKPNYIYISNNANINISAKRITSGYDRFQNIENWYVRTDHIWKIFVKK